jgi:phosphonatase-like hydrolase
MEIELVVFDMAGTTVHDGDAVNSCFRDSLTAAGLKVDRAAVAAVMGLPKREALRRLIERSSKREELADQLDAIHQDFVARMVHWYQTDPDVREVPGAATTFGKLRATGIKVALDSGFSRDIARVILDRLGWERQGLIDASVMSDEVARGRPDPDMIHLLMARLGVRDSRKVAKVGDTPVDLAEGMAAHCGLVVGVTSGTHTREQLLAWPHTHLIESVVDVPALLGRA